MTGRPIIFSAPMVRAILEGRKTQTRRVLKPQPDLNVAGLWVWPPYGTKVTKRTWRGFVQSDEAGIKDFLTYGRNVSEALRYATGDLLWVKETHAIVPASAYRASNGVYQTINLADQHLACVYKAGWERSAPSWKSPLFMPRWASRITLEVKGVRVQRLQEITSADAMAEGCRAHAGSHNIDCDTPDPRDEYRNLWNSLHKKDGMTWEKNPWVVAVTFERVP